MTENQSWSEFDTALRIKLQQAEEPKRYDTETEKEVMTNKYANLTSCVYETIQKVVPERK